MGTAYGQVSWPGHTRGLLPVSLEVVVVSFEGKASPSLTIRKTVPVRSGTALHFSVSDKKNVRRTLNWMKAMFALNLSFIAHQ